MTLIKTNFDSVFEQFDLLFKNFFDNDTKFQTVIENKLPYPVDVYADHTGLRIDIAAVGLDEADINIEVDGDTLKVSRKKDNKYAEDDTKCVYRGISKRAFNFGWKINNKYDLTKIDAKLEKGLLTITIPINETEKTKRFEVKINK